MANYQSVSRRSLTNSFFILYVNEICQFICCFVHNFANLDGLSRYSLSLYDDQITKVTKSSKHHSLFFSNFRRTYRRINSFKIYISIIFTICWPITPHHHSSDTYSYIWIAFADTDCSYSFLFLIDKVGQLEKRR